MAFLRFNDIEDKEMRPGVTFMKLISTRAYIYRHMIILMPLLLCLVWIFYVPFVREEAYDPSSPWFVNDIIIPGSIALLWAITWQIVFFRSLKTYEKHRKHIKLSKQHFSLYETHVDINDIKHHLMTEKFVMRKENLFYRHHVIKGSENDTNEYTFIRIVIATHGVEDAFFKVILEDEPFDDAYKHSIGDLLYKYVIIICREFLDYERLNIEKKCTEWKIEAMRFSRKMPDEFWIPIVYVYEDHKIHVLSFMSKKRRVENLLGIRFIT